jgi:recombination protein RecA
MTERRGPSPSEFGADHALTQAVAQIRRQYGPGAIMRLGDHTAALGVETIPTGALALDRALGIGGIPRGRVVEIYGPDSSGKCLPADTLIATADGLLTIAELFEMHGLAASCTSRTTPARALVQNRFGELEPTTHFTHNNRKPTRLIRTSTGYEIRSTLNHPHLTLSPRGFLVWKRTADFRPGDVLVCARTLSFGRTPHDPDVMYAVGLLLADGYLGADVIDVTTDDPSVKAFIEDHLARIAGAVPRAYPNNTKGSTMYKFGRREAVSALYRITGLAAGARAGDKTVPLPVRRGDRESVRAFLQGYMDSESFVSPRQEIQVTSKSKDVLFTVKLMLQQFGIISSLRPKRVAARPDETYWTLTMSGANARLYRDTIGTRSARIENTWRSWPEENRTSANLDVIPLQGGVLRDLCDSAETTRDHWRVLQDYVGDDPRASPTYDRLDRILASGLPDSPLTAHLMHLAAMRYFFDTIEAIEDHEPEPTFDLAMERTASFVANGIVSHNTTLALHLIANVQRAGGRAAFIDAEHALDPVYARAIGVDTDALLVSQPDYAEQALDIAESLVRSGSVGIVVVDSVAALVPKAELEGDMGEPFVGLQARLMSQALRKLAGAIHRSRTTVVFINQIREKVGVMYGSPEVTSGGRALKFYASVRLEIRRTETLKSGDQVLGQRVRVKVAKNKLASPFREAEFDILFGRGIHTAASIVDAGLDAGVLTRSGAWVLYNGRQLGQGREAASQALQADPALAAEIERRIRGAGPEQAAPGGAAR